MRRPLRCPLRCPLSRTSYIGVSYLCHRRISATYPRCAQAGCLCPAAAHWGVLLGYVGRGAVNLSDSLKRSPTLPLSSPLSCSLCCPLRRPTFIGLFLSMPLDCPLRRFPRKPLSPLESVQSLAQTSEDPLARSAALCLKPSPEKFVY